jgi:hypothetical protein
MISAHTSPQCPYTQDFLACRAGTRWEEVSRLLWGWSKAASRPRAPGGSQLFCLLSIEHLAFEVQTRAAQAIRSLLGRAAAPLLLVSGAGEDQHLLTQVGD